MAIASGDSGRRLIPESALVMRPSSRHFTPLSSSPRELRPCVRLARGRTGGTALDFLTPRSRREMGGSNVRENGRREMPSRWNREERAEEEEETEEEEDEEEQRREKGKHGREEERNEGKRTDERGKM